MRYTYDNSSANVHNPNSPPIRVRAGNRSVDEMAHLWLQVLPVHTPPGAPDPRLLLQEALMRNRLRKSPHDQIGLYNLAAALAGQGKFTQAVDVFRQETALYPHDTRSLTALGAALESASQPQQAEEQYRAAIASATEASGACDARFDLANLEMHRQELSSAESDFRAQLASCPEDAEVYAGLGAIEATAGDNDAAVRDLAQAVRLNPSSEDAREQLARAYAQSGSIDKALAELQTAAQLKPGDPLIHSALSQVLASTGDLHRAIDEQRTALRLLEADPDGWNNLGVLEARTGDAASAREAFEHALRLNPSHQQARANLARLQAQR